jgi:RsiW-degrading membrane proteinase PrsW (M82 family)
MSTTASPPQAPQRSRAGNLVWLWVLVGGAVIWILGAGATAATGDEIFVPTLILTGSFLVPVSMVMFALTRKGEEQLPKELLLMGFVLGGALGVVVAGTVETYLLPNEDGTFLFVGIIEELTKGGIVLLVGSRLSDRRPRHGMVLGATVGAGFAAFESAGYAFTALVKHQDEHPVLNILQTEISRALLSPFGHITWTALFGGALFAACSADGRFRVSRGLVGTVLGVICLHWAWDASYGISIMITQGIDGGTWDFNWPNGEDWIGAPTGSELHIWQVVYDAMLLLNGAVGALWVFHNWRRYGAHEAPQTTARQA